MLPVEVAIGSLMVLVPSECIVKLYVPVIALPDTGLSVKEDPVSIWISLSAARVIKPVNVLSFAVFLIAPF